MIFEFLIGVPTIRFFGNKWLGWKLWNFYISFLRLWGNPLQILVSFRYVFYELWIFDWICPYKSVGRHGCCSHFWDLLAWQKIMKIFWYIIHIIIKVIINVCEFWICIFKVMDFLNSLSCFRVKFGHYFNFWELLDWNKIPKFLLKISYNIF